MSVVKKTAADLAADTKKEQDAKLEQAEAARVKRFKAAFDAGDDVPSPEFRQDVVRVAGCEFEEGVEHEPFALDKKAKHVPVESVAVASNSSHVLLVVNGTYYSLSPQLGVALRRFCDSAAINLSY